MRSFSRRLAWCSSRSGEPNTTGAIAMAVRKHTLDPYDPLQDLRVRAAWEGIPRFLERGKRHHRGVSANDRASIVQQHGWQAARTGAADLFRSGQTSTLLPRVADGPSGVVAGVCVLTLRWAGRSTSIRTGRRWLPPGPVCACRFPLPTCTRPWSKARSFLRPLSSLWWALPSVIPNQLGLGRETLRVAVKSDPFGQGGRGATSMARKLWPSGRSQASSASFSGRRTR